MEALRESERYLIDQCFKEEQKSKNDRLSKEFSVVNDIENTERQLVNQLIETPTDSEKWLEYAMYCLGNNQQLKAEQFLAKVLKLNGGHISTDLQILMASLMLQRKDFNKCKQHLDTVLDGEWKHLHANLLLGFLYKMIGWNEMARKHLAIAKVQRMRDLIVLPPKSSIPKNFRTEAMEFKVEILDFKKIKTTDENLAPKESDLMFF